LILPVLGEKAKINEPVNIVHYCGTKRTDKTVPKYKVLTSHIARKTFITNAMIRGMSTEVIMDITTHSSYKTFNFNDCDLQKFVSSRDMVEIKPQRILV